MEEEQNFEVQQQEPNNKGSKKGLIIAIVIVLILALAGGLYYYFFMNDSTKLQLSNKDKITSALSKVEAKVDEITEGYKNVKERKIAKNLATKPFKNTSTLTAQINELDVEGIEASDVAMAKQLVSGQSITIEEQGNLSEGKVYAKLTALGQEIGNLVLNNNVIGVQVPLLEQKYYAISKDSLSSSKYSKLAEIFNNLNATSENQVNLDNFKLSDSEEKHFKDTYGKVFKQYVTDERITTESAEITVDGKNQKCDKVTYTLDNAAIKSLLKEYATTVKNDTEGQNIVINKVLNIAEEFKVLELAGMTKEQLKTQATSMIPTMLDSLIEGIDEITLEKLEIVVYATNTTTYKIEAGIYEGTNAAKIVAELREKGMKISLQEQSQNLMVFDVEDGNDGLKASIEAEDVKLEISNKKESDTNTFTLKASSEGYDATTIEFRVTAKVNEDTDTKLNQDIEVAIKVKADEVNMDLVLKLNSVTEIVDSITVPEITAENSIDVIKEGYLDSILDEIMDSAYLNTSFTINNPTTMPSDPYGVKVEIPDELLDSNSTTNNDDISDMMTNNITVDEDN